MFQGLGAVCTDSEWSANPDDCERRNLDDYFERNPVAGPAPAAPRTAADLKRLIQQNSGALYVWSANVGQSPELRIVKANPLTFTATPVAGDPGTYKITLASVTSLLPAIFQPKPAQSGTSNALPPASAASDFSSYLPYILLGGGALVVLSLLKK